MSTKEKGKALATTDDAGVPATQKTFDYGDHAGVGFEGTTGKDLSVPFLSVLQANSQQVEKEDPEGSKSGMLYNTVTKELFDGKEGLPFLPCHKEEAFVEWKPDRGGLVGMHDPSGEVVKAAIEANDGEVFGKLMHGENDLDQTYYVYGLFLDPAGLESVGFGVMSFSSTKIRPYRDWITSMYTLKGKPPMFANRAIIRTVRQENTSGVFWNFRIDPLKETWRKSLIDPVAEQSLLEEGNDFREMVVSGMARAAWETQDTSGNDADGNPGGGEPGDAPF